MHALEDSLRFPSGRTVGDCRKDAKRISRTTGMAFSAALDQVAAKNGGQATWSLSVAALRLNQPTPVAVVPVAWPQMTVDDIRKVLEREPRLTRYGWGVSDASIKAAGSIRAAIEEGQRELMDHVDECNKSLRFLQHVQKRKTFNSRVGSSYGLKHQVERYLNRVNVDRPQNPYVANGSFICAALHAGFSINLSSNFGPNVTFNMSSRSPIFEWSKVVDQSSYWNRALAAKQARLCEEVGAGPRQTPVRNSWTGTESMTGMPRYGDGHSQDHR